MVPYYQPCFQWWQLLSQNACQCSILNLDMLPKYKAYFSKLQIRLYLNKLYVVRYSNYGTTKYRELDLTFKRKQLIGN